MQFQDLLIIRFDILKIYSWSKCKAKMQGLSEATEQGGGGTGARCPPPPLFWKQENVPFLHRMRALFDTQ